MELKVFESPGQEWDEFATRYTDLIFYQSVWSEVLRKGLGGQPLYFFLREGGQIVAGLPGVLLNFGVFRILYASIPYGNLIGEQKYFEPFMEVLEKEFKKRGIDQVRISESPFFSSYSPASYRPLPVKCTLLDLRKLDRENIWGGFKKNIRRDVRKAQRSGVTVRTGTGGEDIKMFYKLYLSSMERNRAAAKYPYRWLEAIYEVLFQRGFSQIQLAERDGKAIAGVVFIYSPSSTHYFHNGSYYEFLGFCPNELLIHSALERAIEQNHRYFDFMGSDPLDLSLLRFKEKWGGQSINIRTFVKDYHPLRCKIWETTRGLAASSWGSRIIRWVQSRKGIFSK
jgi:hypothetical protein